MLPVVGYNRFPDEKGTESEKSVNNRHEVIRVTIVSPMKRGLKDRAEHSEQRTGGRYNRFPDEKGTESWPQAQLSAFGEKLQSFPR